MYDAPRMPEFTRAEAKALSVCVERFTASFQRDVAEAIDVPLQKAVDAQLIKLLRRDLVSLELLMAAPWFQETTALRAPALGTRAGRRSRSGSRCSTSTAFSPIGRCRLAPTRRRTTPKEHGEGADCDV